MPNEFVDMMAEQNATQIELRSEWMVRTALGHIKILEDLDFFDIKVSLKAFEVPVMIEAYRRFAALPNDYPLHLGVTEAGTPRAGFRALGGRVGRCSRWVSATRSAFRSPPIRPRKSSSGSKFSNRWNCAEGATMIACPTCGRVEVDLFTIANQIDKFLETVKEPIRVAVMGCVVNGPGEARDADVGLASGNAKGVIFRKGKVVKTVPENEMVQALKDEVLAVLEEKRNGTYEEAVETNTRYKPTIPLTAVR